MGDATHLKPCPFCGNTDLDVDPGLLDGEGKFVGHVMISCPIVHMDIGFAYTCGTFVTGETIAEAAARWNRRPPDAQEAEAHHA